MDQTATTRDARFNPEAGPGDVPAYRLLPGELGGKDGRFLDATEVQYHLFVERVQEYAVFLMDADGVVTHWGEGAERMKEFAPGEVVGRHLSFLYPEGGAEDGTAQEHLLAAARNGEYTGEGYRRARRRGLFPARVTLTALWRDGRLYGFAKVTQDLSERKQVEGALKHALRAAEVANEEKGRFLATMSHELRTPLNAILGYTDLLDVGVAGPLTDRQRGYLERVRSSAHHLMALLEDVLDFARVEAGRLAVEHERGRITDAAHAALELVRPQAQARGLELSVVCDGGEEPEYWGDERRVQQVLVNLLSNALKFTDAGGSITLRCGIVDRAPPEAGVRGEGPWSCVRVEDTGIGIPPDRLATVFEPFVQLEGGLTRTREGSGLGLAISRRLARLMDGGLSVSSTPGKGSAFTLWLPATPEAAAHPAAGDDADEEEEAVPTPLTRISRRVSASAPAVAEALAARLRADPATPQARDLSQSELEDHVGTLVADVAQAFVILEQDGPDSPAIAADGMEVQELLAVRHGQQRHRLGWSEAALEREYEILRAEVEAVVHAAGGDVPEPVRDEASSILARLLGRVEEISLRAFREAGE